jgi:two-component system response regulator
MTKSTNSEDTLTVDWNQQLQILVVEDDATDSLLLARQLAKAQIDNHVIFIDNGKEALDFLLQATAPPFAIFLDLHLPGLSGIELLEKVRQEPRLKAVPVIIMTGSNDPHDVKKCSTLGVIAYLPKPLKLTTFVGAITHVFHTTTISE